MWIMDFFKWQFIDIIRWENPESYLLVKKFSRPLDEIKNDATLIVDPWYAAVFVHNWKIEAIQSESWKFNLETSNIPIISTLKWYMRWFESDDKAAVYFIKTTEIVNQKWWTKNPIKYVDPHYKFPVKLRAFWNFSYKISDIERLWVNYIWTKDEFTIDEVRNIIVDRLMQIITDTFAEMNLSYIEIDKNRVELSENIKSKLWADVEAFWLEFLDFRIEDTNFDEETEELIMKISSQTANVWAMNELKDVDASAMQNYAKTKQLDALESAAENEWSMWWMMWAFMWANLWQNMWTSMNSTMNESNEDSLEVKLSKLKSLLDKWLITQDEYDAKKGDLLKDF